MSAVPAGEPVQSTGPSLVQSTQLGKPRDRDSVWVVKLYPDALEGSAAAEYQGRSSGGSSSYAEQPEEWKRRWVVEVAGRRASGRLRRYVVANRLNRLATLTYAKPCNEPAQASADAGRFFKELRRRIGRPFPYVWVREWHPGGHGLHVHFAVGRFIRQSLIRQVWGLGIVDIRVARGMQQMGAGPAEEARRTARYLAKYLSKGTEEGRIPWSHRYEVAQQFRPKSVGLRAEDESEALAVASEIMGGAPVTLWRSRDHVEWFGPWMLWMAWAG
jgi:hypothetical protein